MEIVCVQGQQTAGATHFAAGEECQRLAGFEGPDDGGKRTENPGPAAGRDLVVFRHFGKETAQARGFAGNDRQHLASEADTPA